MYFVFAVLRGTEESSGWDSTGENNFVLSEQKNEEVSDIVDCPEGNVFCFCGFTRDGGVIGKEINRVRNTSKKYRY